jgi:glutamine synthetase
MSVVEPTDEVTAAASSASDRERLEALRKDGVDTLVIGGADVTGEFRAKRFALNVFSREEVEIAFSNYLFGCDVVDDLMTPRPSYNGFFPTESTGLPDIYVRPDWSQLRILPWDPATAIVLGDYYTHHGDEVAVSPRRVLRKVIERVRSLGYEPMAGSEYEFIVFDVDPKTARENPVGLPPLSHGPAYSNVRGAADEQLMGSVRRMIEGARIPIEAANPEAMPGQVEITLRYSDAMTAADNAFLYKHFIRELLAREGKTASFIAKYDPAGYGSSGHLHISLREGDIDGSPMLVDADGGLSGVARNAIGGLLATLREFTSFYAPVVNSYRRYQADHAWAGDTVSWGFDNRSCGIRVIHTTPGSTRIESRVPGADMNPYIALAASLAAVGHGIEKGIEPPDDIVGDAYTRSDVEKIPTDLHSAVALLDDSEVARDWLGTEFVDFYAETRFWEAEQHRLAVTPWELGRYL